MRKWGIIGALLFVAACVVGFIFNFDGSDIVAIALATFGLTATVIAFVKKHKEKGTPIWQIAIVTVLTLGAGVLVCIGGLADNIFAAISGAVLALMTIIFGLIYNKQKKA
jgi:Na+/H+ antiporter NhaD/arsenite permease-like protein